MRPGRIAALVIGSLLVIPAAASLLGGGALGLGYALGRGDDGYFDATLDRLETDTVALTAEDITFAAEPGSPDWIVDALDTDVRLRATSGKNESESFIGIGREADVDAYLAGVAHDEVIELSNGLEPVYRTRTGSDDIATPAEQGFWVASSAGTGTQELLWEATSGQWSVVVMNADASPGVSTDVNVGLKAPFVLPLSLIMLGIGTVLAVSAAALIVAGASGGQNSETAATYSSRPQGIISEYPTQHHPVALQASLDPQLSRWQWLVKWVLAIPHFFVLAFLGVAFVVLTIVAGFGIVLTGRYPRSIFDFNVGVLRWSWRVTHYATTGGMATDRYPPFSLHPEPDDMASLEIAYPENQSRGLVFVKWLLAIPHIIIVSLLAGGSARWFSFSSDWLGFDATVGGGLLELIVLVAALVLLFTGRYPVALFDLIIGLNRWIYRVVAYVALMTDQYPPFRLDQGGTEPPISSGTHGAASIQDSVDLRASAHSTKGRERV